MATSDNKTIFVQVGDECLFGYNGRIYYKQGPEFGGVLISIPVQGDIDMQYHSNSKHVIPDIWYQKMLNIREFCLTKREEVLKHFLLNTPMVAYRIKGNTIEVIKSIAVKPDKQIADFDWCFIRLNDNFEWYVSKFYNQTRIEKTNNQRIGKYTLKSNKFNVTEYGVVNLDTFKFV